jgi:hypothetical protein
MSRKKISTTIYVTPEQSDRLRLLHERTKVPVAVYIREGIDLVLAQYASSLPGQLDLGVAQPARRSFPLADVEVNESFEFARDDRDPAPLGVARESAVHAPSAADGSAADGSAADGSATASNSTSTPRSSKNLGAARK